MADGRRHVPPSAGVGLPGAPWRRVASPLSAASPSAASSPSALSPSAPSASVASPWTLGRRRLRAPPQAHLRPARQPPCSREPRASLPPPGAQAAPMGAPRPRASARATLAPWGPSPAGPTAQGQAQGRPPPQPRRLGGDTRGCESPSILALAPRAPSPWGPAKGAPPDAAGYPEAGLGPSEPSEGVPCLRCSARPLPSKSPSLRLQKDRSCFSAGCRRARKARAPRGGAHRLPWACKARGGEGVFAGEGGAARSSLGGKGLRARSIVGREGRDA